MSSRIINHIEDIENLTYLELGVFDNKNFQDILSQNKFSVDTNGAAMFTGTTDDFFNNLESDKKFDIIFIDANHDFEYALRDFNNSVDHCNKWILMHDMIPPSAKQTQSRYCSDSYKILYHMLKYENFEVYPMSSNFGLTLIKMPAQKICPGEETINLSYLDFINYISNRKLYNDDEIINILNNKK